MAVSLNLFMLWLHLGQLFQIKFSLSSRGNAHDGALGGRWFVCVHERAQGLWAVWCEVT